MIDHYSILGLTKDASKDEIKKAYRKLAIKFHPDKNDGDEFLAEMFKKISAAYEILNDESKKSFYDNNLNNSDSKDRSEEKSSSTNSNKSNANHSQNTAKATITNAINNYFSSRKHYSNVESEYTSLKNNQIPTHSIKKKVFWWSFFISLILQNDIIGNNIETL